MDMREQAVAWCGVQPERMRCAADEARPPAVTPPFNVRPTPPYPPTHFILPQGKFQFLPLPTPTHAVHEDAPREFAAAARAFLGRYVGTGTTAGGGVPGGGGGGGAIGSGAAGAGSGLGVGAGLLKCTYLIFLHSPCIRAQVHSSILALFGWGSSPEFVLRTFGIQKGSQCFGFAPWHSSSSTSCTSTSYC